MYSTVSVSISEEAWLLMKLYCFVMAGACSERLTRLMRDERQERDAASVTKKEKGLEGVGATTIYN
jgi:hypothetical protein